LYPIVLNTISINNNIARILRIILKVKLMNIIFIGRKQVEIFLSI